VEWAFHNASLHQQNINPSNVLQRSLGKITSFCSSLGKGGEEILSLSPPLLVIFALVEELF